LKKKKQKKDETPLVLFKSQKWDFFTAVAFLMPRADAIAINKF
jgi:hypothetical protein